MIRRIKTLLSNVKKAEIREDEAPAYDAQSTSVEQKIKTGVQHISLNSRF